MFGFGFINSVFPVIFTVMFVGIFAIFIVSAVRGIGRWHKNNNSPRLTVPATHWIKNALCVRPFPSRKGCSIFRVL